MGYKFGYVGLIGRANAGKSTLINALVGQKVAIISPKPQTTRNNILGILTENNYQIAFIDTPGIHTSKNVLDKYMMKNVRSALGGADVVVYLIDGTKSLDENEKEYVKKLIQDGLSIIIAVTKIDLAGKNKVFALLAGLNDIAGVLDIVPISSLQNKNIDILKSAILKQLPESKEKNFGFNEDEFTDKSLIFMICETIRETALNLYSDEIPHGLAIEVIKFEEKEHITNIDVDIICERDTHKSIILGAKGSKIKKLGENARHKIEELLDCKIMLKLFVKVEPNWRNNPNNLTDFGYNSKFE